MRRTTFSLISTHSNLENLRLSVEMFTDVIDGGFHAAPATVIISPSASLEYAAAKLGNKNYKVLLFRSWDDVCNGRGISMGGSTTPPASDIGGSSQSAGIDPMLVVGHLDP